MKLTLLDEMKLTLLIFFDQCGKCYLHDFHRLKGRLTVHAASHTKYYNLRALSAIHELLLCIFHLLQGGGRCIAKSAMRRKKQGDAPEAVSSAFGKR